MKRKHRNVSDSESDHGSPFSIAPGDDIDVDISYALVGKRPKLTQMIEEEDDDGLANFLQASISKRSMKEGTQVLKITKGKIKMTKGEVGGGSFQSMGE